MEVIEPYPKLHLMTVFYYCHIIYHANKCFCVAGQIMQTGFSFRSFKTLNDKINHFCAMKMLLSSSTYSRYCTNNLTINLPSGSKCEGSGSQTATQSSRMYNQFKNFKDIRRRNQSQGTIIQAATKLYLNNFLPTCNQRMTDQQL